MLEIEKIKAYIESHNKCAVFENLKGEGWLLNDAKCEIDYDAPRSPHLTVFYEESGQREVIFSACEKDFKAPTPKAMQKMLDEKKEDESVCLHWRVHKLGKNGDMHQIVLSHLTIDNYLKAIELYNKRYKN